MKTIEESTMRIPTGNYEQDLKTAIEMYKAGDYWYVRFLNDARMKLGVDFFEFKNAVENSKE